MNKRKLVSIFVTFLLVASLEGNAEDKSATSGKPSVESFFNDPAVAMAKLSPNGEHVALISKIPSGRYVLVVVDTSDVKKASVVANFSKYDIVNVRWVNNNRMVFRIRSLSDDDARANWSEYAVNRDGSEQTQLILSNWSYSQEDTGSRIKRHILTADYHYFGATHDGSDDIIVSKSSYNNVDYHRDSMRLYRLNTKTLHLTDMLEGAQPKGIKAFLLDMNRDIRIAQTFSKGRDVVSYRDPKSNEWTQIGDFDYLSNTGFFPEFFDANGKLYVRASYKGYAAIYRYDLNERKMESEPLLSMDGFDFDGNPEIDFARKKLLGIHYQTDASGTVWFDTQFKEIQKKVDAILPQTINTVTCGDCVGSRTVLISSASDRQPTQYFVYNTTTGAISGLGGTNPDINPAQMGMRDFHRYTARDGMSIPAYVTLPSDKATDPRPTVVLVHGGPNVRGTYWEWDTDAQFLASRGYVVIQPEYRGSKGFGFRHFRAGWKQWGQSMQDDLADAAKWAVAKGWADPKRIAIVGASYGGYATLMGLIKHSDLFKCGAAWAAVTDIDLMFNTPEGDASLDALEYDMKTLVGDPKADAAVFKAHSPLANADRLTQPLLLAHGAQDMRVPLVHGTTFRNAVSKANKQVEWIQYVDEDHNLHHQNNRIDFWARVDAFLEKNLKSRP